jgi:hypothetical protein
VADVEFHVIAVSKVRAPAGVKLDLQEVIEALVYVVLCLGTATVATKLEHKRLRPDISDPHGGS